jgi:hypothetical protein
MAVGVGGQAHCARGIAREWVALARPHRGQWSGWESARSCPHQQTRGGASSRAAVEDGLSRVDVVQPIVITASAS